MARSSVTFVNNNLLTHRAHLSVCPLSLEQLNLDVEEVGMVRERMQGWRDNLHTPLILDLIFEERDTSSGLGGVKYRVSLMCRGGTCVIIHSIPFMH